MKDKRDKRAVIGVVPATAQLEILETPVPGVGTGAPTSSPSATSTACEIWPAELTHRLRVMLHTAPLDTLRRGDSMRDAPLRHYDGMALALRVLDAVIDRLGLEEEADRESLTRALAPVLSAMDTLAGMDPNTRRHDGMVEKVLGALRNDGDARRPFREEYTALGDGAEATRHAMEFRLLFDAFHPSGKTVIRPSNEACNLYLRLLDLDIEDAQSAAEAVVESQLARGRFDEAVHSARQARIQSVRFREKVMTKLRETRRDVDRIDWREEVPRMLDDARTHLKRRLSVERGILDVADERLDTLPDEDEEGRQAVARVHALVKDCQNCHTELHGQLMGARNVFLDAQAQQSFSPRPSRPLPNLPEDVLEPVLGLPLGASVPLVGQGLSMLTGAQPPIALLDYPALVSWMIQPRRARPRKDIPVVPVDPSMVDAELLRYPAEIRAEAAELLGGMRLPARLSEAMQVARDQGAGRRTLEVLTLLVLQGYASEDRAAAGVASDRADGARLEDPDFHGDDLIISAVGGHNARAS